MAVAGGAVGSIRLAFAVGSIIMSLLPKPRPPLPDLRFQTTQTGVPVPVIYGTNRVACNLIWIGNYQQIGGSKGGKGGGGGKGSQDNTPSYSCSFAVGICEGPITAVLSVWQDNQVVLSQGQTTQNLNAGGKGAKSGKFSKVSPGTVTFYLGTGTNVADPTINQFKGVNLGFLGGGSIGALQSTFTESFNAEPNSTYQVVNGPIVSNSDAVYWLNPTYILLQRVGSNPSYGQYSITSGGKVTLGPGPSVGSSWNGQTVYVGYQAQNATQNVADQNVPGYPYTCYAVFTNWVLGKVARIPNFTFEVERNPLLFVTASHTVYAQAAAGAGGSHGNVYVTSDGQTWNTFRGDDGSNTGISYFWLDEFNNNQNGVFVDGNGGATGSYYTLNNGANWTVLPTLPTGAALAACLPDGTLIATTSSAGACHAYYSTNGGSTWTDAGALPNQSAHMQMYIHQFARASDGSIFLFGYDSTNGLVNVWKSTNEGQTWTTVLNQAATNGNLYAISYKKTAAGNDILMVSTSISSGLQVQIYRSTNLGASWSTIVVDNVKHGSYSGGQYASAPSIAGYGNPGYCANGDWMAFGGYTIDGFGDSTMIFWRSQDDGLTWSVDPLIVQPGAAPASAPWGPESIVWGDSTNTTWACILPNKNNAGLWQSTDGGHTWTAYTAGVWAAAQLGVSAMWSTQASISSTIVDDNPAAIIYDLLTNTRYGAGIPTAAVDKLGTFKLAYTYYQQNNILMSPVLRDHKPLLAHIEELLVLCDSFLVFSQGLFKLIPRQQVQPVTTITTASYTKDKQVEVTRLGPDSLVNRVMVHYAQRNTSTTQQTVVGTTTTANLYTLKVQEAKDSWTISGDVGQSAQVGAGRSGRGSELMVGADGITTDALASMVAYRILWTRASNRLQATIPVGPQHAFLEPADVITWNDLDRDISNVLMRIMAVDEDKEGRLQLQCIEENPIILGWGAAPAGVAGQYPLDINAQVPNTILSLLEMNPEWAQGNGSILALIGGVDARCAGAAIFGSNDGATYVKIASAADTPVGYLVTALRGPAQFPQPAPPGVSWMDMTSVLQVTVLTPATTLQSVTDQQWRLGVNQIVIGGELIYYQNATLVSGTTWNLTNLIRGAQGTVAAAGVPNQLAWIIGQNGSGALVITPQSTGQPLIGLQPLFGSAIAWNLVGRTLYFKAATIDTRGGQQGLSNVTAQTLAYLALGGQPMDVEFLRVPGYGDGDTSVEVAASPNRNLALAWHYQSPYIQEDMEFNQGNVPAHDPKWVQYRITIADANGNKKNTYTSSTESFTYTEADNIADFGSWTSVVQVTVQVVNNDGGLSPGITRTYTLIH